MNFSWRVLIAIILIILIVLLILYLRYCIPENERDNGGQVSLEGMEVTQAIQDMSHSVPLIAEKPTVVRAYFKAQSAAVKVTAKLEVTLPNGVTQPSIDSICADRTLPCVVEIKPTDDLYTKRLDAEKSMNFLLPSEWITAGPGDFTFKIKEVKDATTQSVIPCSDCETFSQPRLSLSSSPILRLMLVGVQFQKDSRPADPPPRPEDYKTIASWLERAYPIGSKDKYLFVDQHPLNFLDVPISDRDYRDGLLNNLLCNYILTKVSEQRAVDAGSPGAADTLQFTHYFGLVYDGGDSAPNLMGGCSPISDPGAGPFFFTTVGSGATGPVGKKEAPWFDGVNFWDSDHSYGDWYTGHELGHNLGRRHIETSASAVCATPDPTYELDRPYENGQLSNAHNPADAIQTFVVGFDIGDPGLGVDSSGKPIAPMRALAGDKWHDIMTYCAQQWISLPTYKAILERLFEEGEVENQVVSSGIGAPAPRDAELINPSGTLLSDRVKTAEDASPRSSTLAATWRQLGFTAPMRFEPPVFVPSTIFIPVAHAEEIQSSALLAQETPSKKDGKGPTQKSAKQQAAKILEGDLITVLATVNLTRKTGEIGPVIRVTRELVPLVPQDKFVRIRLTDARGKEIDDQPAKVMILTSAYAKQDKKQDKLGSVRAVFPYTPGAATLELFLDNKLIAKLKASPNSPEFTTSNIIKPPEIDTTSASKTNLRFSWDIAKDADTGDRVTYRVQMRVKETDNWRTVALDLPRPVLELSADRFKDFKTIQIRVTATDGYHSTSVTSDIFPIAVKSTHGKP